MIMINSQCKKSLRYQYIYQLNSNNITVTKTIINKLSLHYNYIKKSNINNTS